MKNRYTLILLSLFMMCFFYSCTADDEIVEKEDKKEEQTIVSKSLEIDISEESWTYFSIEEQRVVGKSKIGVEEERAWHDRFDWDIAFSEKGVKTNSGKSGIGKGGIHKIFSKDFEEVNEVSEEGYMTDEFHELKLNR